MNNLKGGLDRNVSVVMHCILIHQFVYHTERNVAKVSNSTEFHLHRTNQRAKKP